MRSQHHSASLEAPCSSGRTLGFASIGGSVKLPEAAPPATESPNSKKMRFRRPGGGRRGRSAQGSSSQQAAGDKAQPVFSLAASADGQSGPDLGKMLVRRPQGVLHLLNKDAVLFAAGALAGALSKTVTAPLDRVKILLQVKGGNAGAAVSKAAASGNLVESLLAIGREEGLMGYWRGNAPQVLRVLPYSAAQLYSYEVFKKMLADKETGKLKTTNRLLAGAAAGIFSTAATYPLDTLRLRMAADASTNTLGAAARALWLEGGVPSFYRGVAPAVLGIAPYLAMELCAFDLAPAHVPAFVRGFGAALLATTCFYPLDTIRRNVQLHAGTFGGAATAMFRSDGVAGFYRGFAPNLVKNLPNKGIRLACFEAVKGQLATAEAAYNEEAALQESEAKELAKELKEAGSKAMQPLLGR